MIRIAAASVLAALLAGTTLAPARAQTTAPVSPTPGASSSTSSGTTGTTSTRSHRRQTTSASAAPGKPSGRDQFATEAAARRSCPSDTVVWANSSSKTLHMSGDRYYGKTKRGAFMCERQAMQDGYHVAGRGAAKTKITATSK